MSKRNRKNETTGSDAGFWTLLAVIVLLIVGGTGWMRTAARDAAGERVPDLGNAHISSLDEPHEPYNTTPPTSGPHIGSVPEWGIHAEQIPDESQVHALEDGGVIVHYDPELTDDETLERLKDLIGEHRDHVILEPYEGMDAPIVLTAWARIDRLRSLDEDRIRAFIRSHKGVDHHKR